MVPYKNFKLVLQIEKYMLKASTFVLISLPPLEISSMNYLFCTFSFSHTNDVFMASKETTKALLETN